MDDLFGDDFTTSVPATTPATPATPMESTPAVPLDDQLGLGDVTDGLGVMTQTVTADPAESFITKEKVQNSVNYKQTIKNSMYN